MILPWLILTAECVSVTVAITRWSRRYYGGVYLHAHTPDAGEAFMGHLSMGLFPPVLVAVLIGASLHRRDVEVAEHAKELAEAQSGVDRLLKG